MHRCRFWMALVLCLGLTATVEAKTVPRVKQVKKHKAVKVHGRKAPKRDTKSHKVKVHPTEMQKAGGQNVKAHRAESRHPKNKQAKTHRGKNRAKRTA
ncbi:MAG TPA: hypothetical protein VG675_11845 [Bryobacteraceae bacterium]|nr:hypothetical protein [Bryobacteraceae bacterium]